MSEQWISIMDFLKCETGFNDENFMRIREQYRKQCGGQFPDSPSSSALNELADQLKIKLKSAESREQLNDCVSSSQDEDSRTLTKAIWDARMMTQNVISNDKPSVCPSTTNTHPVSVSSNVEKNVITVLLDIDCLLTIKMASSKVSSFIHSFFLQPIERLDEELTCDFILDHQPIVLDVHCPLYLFIGEHLRECGPRMSIAHHNSTHIRLVEPISLTDEFGTWFYDHWRGLFDLELKFHGDNVQFAGQWCLADNVKIHCRIESCASGEETSVSSHRDRPRTGTLDAFVQDICAHENNGQSDAWSKALRQEDISTFEHLTNLNQSEWDKIKLTTNARKILKAAVDRERRSAAGERRRQVIQDPNDQNKEEIESMITPEKSSISDCELLANLHLIKLFVWHKLRDHRDVQRYGSLAKLEVKCLDAAFNEMQAEGFADDGLFPKMKEFFLSLSISQKELHLKRASNKHIRLTRFKELHREKQQYIEELNEKKDAAQKYDEESRQLEQQIKDIDESIRVLVTRKASKNQPKQRATPRQPAQDVRHRQSTYLQQLQQVKQNKDILEKNIIDCQNKIQETNVRIDRIGTELNTPHQPVDEQLVKPPRGLIMYGPPGTGKSDILGKLAKKLGILMVGPPLAAGELNRSLVGETERILVALCLRCHQVPYAMCCISIDEIDSLAPKRNEKSSSEGKVDKLSVLLSYIEGINDVPNLMILSATNRLHMMDEAFLRRMSGKFFVGRPSSNARIDILRKIPFWAIDSELLDGLSNATTNFSGAAVKALTRAITVKCMTMQRSQSNYQISEIESLKIADRTAQQYQIFIGSETLPRLLLRNKSADSHHSHAYHLLPNVKYTGRMIVDLHNKHIRIERFQDGKNVKNGQLSIIEHQIDPNENNVQTLLERLTAYGKSRNVQLLQLIDLNLLASQGAYDEQKVYETLKDRYDECVSYSRSMIVYDLDALVGVKKTESDANMSRSTSSEIHNQSIYRYVLARFRDQAMEENQKNQTDSIERWAVAVIREPFLLRQFSSDAQYPLTRQQQDELDLERHKAEDLLKCVKCKDFYIENENRMGSCLHHDGFVFDNEASDLEKYTPSEVAKCFREFDRKILGNPNQRDKFEQQKTKFKWICCDEKFTDARTGGCKHGEHGFFPRDNDSTSRQMNAGKTDQLNKATIEQWEDACLENDEYNAKWVSLATEY